MTAQPVELVWSGEHSPELDELVIENILQELRDMNGNLVLADDLMFHTVSIGPSIDSGPVVLITGGHGDGKYHCEYLKEHPEELSSHMDEIPGFKEKLKAAGWKDPNDE